MSFLFAFPFLTMQRNVFVNNKEHTGNSVRTLSSLSSSYPQVGSVAAESFTQCGLNKERDILLTNNTALCRDPRIFQASLLGVNSWDKTTLNRFGICKDFLETFMPFCADAV